jgi:peptide/nickel transport system permease protein
MGSYIGRQLLTIIPTVLLSIVVNFALLHAAPGDPARIYAGMDTATEEQIAAMREDLGLDDPLLVQFVNYVEQLLHGNLGMSLAFRQPV